jgi:hypothetical protein
MNKINLFLNTKSPINRAFCVFQCGNRPKADIKQCEDNNIYVYI